MEHTLCHAKALASSLTASREKYSKKSADFKSLRSEHEKLLKKQSETNFELDQSLMFQQELEKKNETLSNALSDAADHMAEMEKELVTKQELIQQFEQFAEDWGKAEEEWKKEKEATMKQEKERQYALEAFLIEQKTLLSEVESGEKERETLKGLLQESEEQNERLREELDKHKADLTIARDTIEKQMEEDEGTMDELRKEAEITEAKRIEEVGQLSEELEKESKDRQRLEQYLVKMQEVLSSVEHQLTISEEEKKLLANQVSEKIDVETRLKTVILDADKGQEEVTVRGNN